MNDKIDLKKWTIPTSWDEMTLLMFQQLENEKVNETFEITDILHILAGKTKDEVMQLPVEFIDIMLSKLDFLKTPMEKVEPSPSITIGKDTYTVNTMQKLKTGEYISLNNIIKADPKNFAAMLAVMCRKEGEVYDSKFEAEVFEDRVKMFERQPITKVMPIVAFFLELSMMLNLPSQLSSMVEEEISHIVKELETSQKIGALKKHYYRWRMTRLLKQLNLKKPI